MKVPFCKPVWLPEHETILNQAIKTGWTAGNGAFTKKSEALLEQITGSPHRLVSSATHALEMMGLLADIQPGDEVIVPSFTFVSTANAFSLRGAKLLFADNDQYGNILPSEIERLRTPMTKAVVSVDYAGASADYDQIIELKKKYGFLWFEDAAQSIGGSYKNKPLGSQADLACFSFHETKNVGCGEGGSLIFGNKEYLDRAEILREKGTNRSQFYAGLADKYTWMDIGSSYLMSDINAAFLYPQLELLSSIQKKRQQIWKTYEQELSSAFAAKDFRLLQTPAHNTANYHMFAFCLRSEEQRNDFIKKMKEHGITATFHYLPLHKSPYAAKTYGQANVKLAGCEQLSATLVRLPLYFNMSADEQAYTVEKVKQVIADF